MFEIGNGSLLFCCDQKCGRTSLNFNHHKILQILIIQSASVTVASASLEDLKRFNSLKIIV